MKKLTLFLCLIASLATKAQKEKVEAYITTYKETAIVEMMRTGVPAAITLAQGILESQSGQSDLVKNSNNHFGIKCKPEWTGDKFYHDDDAKGECFRVYPTAAQSYMDHSDFLKSRPHYAFLFKLDPTDYEGWAYGLKKAGYATLPTYPQKLLKLINEYSLQQYSLEAIARLKNGELPATSAAVLANSEPQKQLIEVKALTSAEPVASASSTPTGVADEKVVVVQTDQPLASKQQATQKTTNYPAGMFTINHTRVIYGSAGTSLLSLANLYEIPLSKLLEYNELAEMDVLDADRLLFIEKKQKRGASDYHTVTDGESLYTISQVEGVRLESLMEYNSLKKDAKVSTGDKIYLRAITQAAAEKPGKTPKKVNG